MQIISQSCFAVPVTPNAADIPAKPTQYCRDWPHTDHFSVSACFIFVPGRDELLKLFGAPTANFLAPTGSVVLSGRAYMMENEDAEVVSRTEERKKEKGRAGGPCEEALEALQALERGDVREGMQGKRGKYWSARRSKIDMKGAAFRVDLMYSATD